MILKRNTVHPHAINKTQLYDAGVVSVRSNREKHGSHTLFIMNSLTGKCLQATLEWLIPALQKTFTPVTQAPLSHCEQLFFSNTNVMWYLIGGQNIKWMRDVGYGFG